MSRNIYIPLTRDVREALYTLAEREFRRPKEQAQKLLVEGLRHAGALPAEQAPTDPRPELAPVGRIMKWPLRFAR